MPAPVLIAGHKVEAYVKRTTGGDPAVVTVSKMGSGETSYFTPAEARALAKTLEEQADAAEVAW